MFSEPMRGVSLLIAVPLDEEEFFQRVTESDWLSKFDDPTLSERARREWIAQRWRSEYAPVVAAPLRGLMDAASALGVAVQTAATLSSLAEATANACVVILFAHWKGPEVNADDLRGTSDPVVFAERAAQDDSPASHWLCSHGLDAPRRPSLFRRARPVSVREILTGFLDAKGNDLATAGGVDLVLESKVTRAARRRDELDRLFAGLLRPGNRLELFSGLHSKEEVEASVAPHFDGVLDLTTCTSTVLADFIARERRQGLRTVQFPEVQDLAWAAECVLLTLNIAAERQLPYQSARALATEIVERAVTEAAAEFKAQRRRECPR